MRCWFLFNFKKYDIFPEPLKEKREVGYCYIYQRQLQYGVRYIKTLYIMLSVLFSKILKTSSISIFLEKRSTIFLG